MVDNPVPETVNEAWSETLENDLRGNMLMDSPLGKSCFIGGVAWAIVRLRDNWSRRELKRITAEAEAFIEAYMEESRQIRLRRANYGPPFNALGDLTMGDE